MSENIDSKNTKNHTVKHVVQSLVVNLLIVVSKGFGCHFSFCRSEIVAHWRKY